MILSEGEGMYRDKNGREIIAGQYASVLDREGNEWIGIIKYIKAKYKGQFTVEGKEAEGVSVFHSNMIVWLGDWTKEGLTIEDRTDYIEAKYKFQSVLHWGYYYSLETIENYHREESIPSSELRIKAHEILKRN